MTNKRKIINDPVYGFLTIDDDILYDVISHPYFQRQRQIKQLGFTYMVYPGATHSRFSHMLGALNLMCRAVDVLRNKGVEISDEESRGVRLAILLHDIGHGPFSHTSERVLSKVHHETLTSLFMERLNKEFGGQLDTAIAIFNNTYPRHFLHQLVSSQLDMDRLDYLARDSFFTGVHEGVIGTERIINMLNVSNDTLVIDEKGIYSVEKFIISRRLMYWQVYLHKTVIACDMLFLNTLKRARALLEQGEKLEGYAPLLYFLSHNTDESDYHNKPELLELFASIDDNDLISSIKSWTQNSDFIISTLATQLVNRQLGAIRVSSDDYDKATVDEYRSKTAELYHISESDADYFVNTGRLENHAYSFDDSEIKVLYKSGECKGISESSDQLDRPFLEKTVTKYYLNYPKALK
ncbi:MAG: HD domain-containing protein [Bacteroidales bacterium]|nr:HD domain-containing protein [Bacteroidales bacterium]